MGGFVFDCMLQTWVYVTAVVPAVVKLEYFSSFCTYHHRRTNCIIILGKPWVDSLRGSASGLDEGENKFGRPTSR